MKNNDIVAGFDDEMDESLKIRLEKTEKDENCLILHLTGYIDTYNSNFFQKMIQKAIDAGFIKLVFQCSDLNYVSSTGIGSFTVFLKNVKPKGGTIVLLGFQPKVFEVFQLLGFSQFFHIKDSIEDALEFLSAEFAEENAPLFPGSITCPNCSKKLKVPKPGRYNCSECKAVLSVDASGKVTLG